MLAKLFSVSVARLAELGNKPARWMEIETGDWERLQDAIPNRYLR
jgi:hypothetical protein